MIGLLITNKWTIDKKFDALTKGFINASKKLNVNLEYKNNFEAYDLINHKTKYDFVLFYDKDIKLAKMLEKTGYILFNNSDAISICDDKFLTYIHLINIVNQPLTIPSPFLYYGDLSGDNDFLNKCEKTFEYPLIIKECYGSFGKQVYKIDNREQFIDRLKIINNKQFIVQKFIKTSFGKDIRAQVVGNEVICSIMRQNHNGDFRANLTNDSKGYKFDINDIQKDICVKSTKAIGLDFAGVDLLFDENDNFLLCEINSNAHLENINTICQTNLYVDILKYIVSKVK